MTRRERLERKLERREEWADKAKTRSASRFNAAHKATEGIPPGQPILVGHHSEQRHRAALDRQDRNMRKGIEESDLAAHHASKADGLSRQLDNSIFSDDHDAIEQLEARIAEREAERDRWKAYNASCRKGRPDLSLLDDKQRREIESIARVCSYQLGKNGAAPGYVLTNLGACIRKDRERVKEIRRRAERAEQADTAGGVLIEYHDCGTSRYCSVTFAEKPEYEVRRALKDAGFRWGSGHWFGPADKLPDCVRELADEAQTEGGA